MQEQPYAAEQSDIQSLPKVYKWDTSTVSTLCSRTGTIYTALTILNDSAKLSIQAFQPTYAQREDIYDVFLYDLQFPNINVEMLTKVVSLFVLLS